MMAEKKRFKQNREFRKGLDEDDEMGAGRSGRFGQKFGRGDRKDNFRGERRGFRDEDGRSGDRRNFHDEDGHHSDHRNSFRDGDSYRGDRRAGRRDYDRRGDRAMEKARAKASSKFRKNNNNRFENDEE